MRGVLSRNRKAARAAKQYYLIRSGQGSICQWSVKRRSGAAIRGGQVDVVARDVDYVPGGIHRIHRHVDQVANIGGSRCASLARKGVGSVGLTRQQYLQLAEHPLDQAEITLIGSRRRPWNEGLPHVVVQNGKNSGIIPPERSLRQTDRKST